MKNILKKFVSLSLVGLSTFFIAPKTEANTDIEDLNVFFESFNQSLKLRLKCSYTDTNQAATTCDFIMTAICVINSAYYDINKNPCNIEKIYSNNDEVIEQYIVKPLQSLNISKYNGYFNVPEKVLLLNAAFGSNSIKPILSLGVDEYNECLCLASDSGTNKFVLKSYNIG